MIDKQQRTNREEGLENIMESMYGEDCGAVHVSAKRKKKKVKEAGIDPETGEDQSDAKHAKQDLAWLIPDNRVQWTKKIKAKLAQAQKIGDSKEANKLQRFLDTHGVDEAYVKEGTKCDHCDGEGWHNQEEYPFAKKKCDRCDGDGWLDDTGDRDDPGVVKEAGGDYMALRQEVDEYLTTAVHTTGAEDLKANVLEIIDRHLGGAGAAPAPVPAPAPTGPISSPARQSQSPLRPSGMSGPGMMP